MAAPATYTVNGEQYVAVMAGFGGAGGFSFAPETAAYQYGNAGRIVALKLGGGTVPKPPKLPEDLFEKPSYERSSRAQVVQGEILYNRTCSRCHVLGRGLLPDLRRLSGTNRTLFLEIVLHGAYEAKGMRRFDDVLSEDDARAVHAYLVDEAWKAYEAKASPDTRAN
jgi:quinohemoprotein ethanol dehydrogenase